MATISTYTAQRRLQPTSTPRVSVDNTMANALQNLGGSIEGAAEVFANRAEKKSNFAAENAYRRFNIEVEQELNNRAQSIEPGGTGFHDAFLTDVYRPKRDQFLATVPENMRERFQVLLDDEQGADTANWSTRAATVERDEGYRWAKSEVSLTQQQMTQAISLNPETFETYLTAGEELIESAPLPTPERELMKQEWRKMAQVASLDAMMQSDPQGVLRVLGVDTRQLSPTSQFQVLSRAVQWQESTDNPNAVSPKGAVGLMQVMPDTARDIAKALGDENFPTNGSTEEVSRYMTNPFVNKRYGEEYLRQQLKTFSNTRNPIETALVAYNAGPGVAQKWVESGYNDALLPKETRDYKSNILKSISAPTAVGDPTSVRLRTSDGKADADLTNVSGDLISRVQTAYSVLGVSDAKVNSAYRDHDHNKAVGGAEDSQHTKGGALDLNVAGMPIAQRIELIKALSAAGVTGIGIGANIIHADIGGRRAWGYATSAGGGAVPKWAEATIAEHLKGTTPPVRQVAGAYSDLPYDVRKQYVATADNAISSQLAAANKATATQKVEVRRSIDNEIATVRTTGVTTGLVDDTAVATVLGEDEYLRYIDRKETAQRTFTAVGDIPSLSLEEITRRIEDYEPVAGSADFARQQEVQAAVQKEADRVIRLRAKDPGAAALLLPEVKTAWDTLSANPAPQPNEVQSFVRTMLETQAQFDVAPDARAPIPTSWALEIGRALSRTPEPAGRNMEDVRYSIQAQYESLKQFFGDYTDEVIIHSLAEYKGISKTTGEVITGYMQAIQGGGNPFRRRGASAAEDMDQVDSMSFTDYGELVSAPYNNAIANLMGGGQNSEVPDSSGMSPEQMLRSQPPEE